MPPIGQSPGNNAASGGGGGGGSAFPVYASELITDETAPNDGSWSTLLTTLVTMSSGSNKLKIDASTSGITANYCLFRIVVASVAKAGYTLSFTGSVMGVGTSIVAAPGMLSPGNQVLVALEWQGAVGSATSIRAATERSSDSAWLVVQEVTAP